MFARLDRRAREHDPADAFVEQRGHGHRDRQIGFACSGRTDTESEVVMFNRVNIAPLVDCLGRKNFLAEGARLAAFDQPAEGAVRIGRYDPHVTVQVAIAENVAFAYQVDVIGKNPLGPVDVGLVAFYLEALAIEQACLEMQLGFEQADIFIAGAEQRFNAARYLNGKLHQKGNTGERPEFRWLLETAAHRRQAG